MTKWETYFKPRKIQELPWALLPERQPGLWSGPTGGLKAPPDPLAHKVAPGTPPLTSNPGSAPVTYWWSDFNRRVILNSKTLYNV